MVYWALKINCLSLVLDYQSMWDVTRNKTEFHVQMHQPWFATPVPTSIVIRCLHFKKCTDLVTINVIYLSLFFFFFFFAPNLFLVAVTPSSLYIARTLLKWSRPISYPFHPHPPLPPLHTSTCAFPFFGRQKTFGVFLLLLLLFCF